MRRESSTVVVLIGETGEGLLSRLAASPNVSVVRAPAPRDGQPDDGESRQPGWEPGALAMREAARRRSTYVIVPEDPLASVAVRWQAMWEVPAGQAAAAGFEEDAGDALAAWRGKQFELPDYYLVVAPAHAEPAAPDLYLGPLRAVRPRRVAVTAVTQRQVEPAQIIATLRSLEHGPWWPPLDELLDATRRFYPGALSETGSAASAAPVR
jgi:hypothetical protein